MSYMNGLSAAKNPNSEFGYRQQLYTCARKLIQSLIEFDKQFLQFGSLTRRSRASAGHGRFFWQIHGSSPSSRVWSHGNRGAVHKCSPRPIEGTAMQGPCYSRCSVPPRKHGPDDPNVVITQADTD